MKAYEKFFTFIGLVGFLFLIPTILSIFNIHFIAELLENNLGTFGTAPVLTIIGFCLIGTMVIFGGGDNLSATFIGLISGFFLVSTAVDIGFMQWFKSFTSDFEVLSNLQLNYLCGIAVVLFGILLSFIKKVNLGVELLILILFPAAFLVSSSAYGFFKFENQFSLSVNQGFETLAQAIDEKYRSMPQVVKYVEKITSNDEIDDEEKSEKLKELQEKIAKLENDKKILEDLKKQNEQYKKVIEQQKSELNNIGWCSDAKNNEERTKTFKEAVKPNQPCVRDFAVNLVKDTQGPYSSTPDDMPGESGINQICNIHRFLSTNWKYISDPTVMRDDYYSPADRTLAIGFAGDCDDYSIMMASSVEAIGGEARIVGGTCDGGAHAWAEVLIGDSKQWNTAKKRIHNFFNHNEMELNPTIDEQGNYWLPLDWRMGQYTCNDAELWHLYRRKSI